MKTFDDRFIDPAPEELAQALLRAMRAANSQLHKRRVERRLAFWRSVVRRTRRPPEGLRQWVGGRGGHPAAQVVLCWWADHVGRKHYRVIGQRAPWPWAQAPVPLMAAHPLARIYPDHVVLRQQNGLDELLAVCPCGACGRPADIGWTGERCGPCHDRFEEGAALPVGMALTLAKDATEVGVVAFTHDGRLVSAEGRAVVVRELVHGTVEAVLQERPNWAGPLAVSPDDMVAIATGPGRVILHDLASGARKFELGNRWIACQAFSPDGRWLALSGHGVFLLDRQGERARTLRETDNFYDQLAWAPDGRTVYVTDRTARIHRLNMDEGTPAMLPERPQPVVHDPPANEYDYEDEYPVNALACSADGQWLAVGTTAFGRCRLDLCHLPTEKWSVLPFPEPIPGIRAVAISPDSRAVVAAGADRVLYFWGLPSQREIGRLHGGGYYGHFSLAFSPDGQVLAASSYGDGIKLCPWRRLLGLG
jgi:hypothetical protein